MVDACMVNECQSDLPPASGCGYECGETSRRAVGPAPCTHKENNAKGRWLGAGCGRMQPKPIMCFAKEIPSYRAPGKILFISRRYLNRPEHEQSMRAYVRLWLSRIGADDEFTSDIHYHLSCRLKGLTTDYAGIYVWWSKSVTAIVRRMKCREKHP